MYCWIPAITYCLGVGGAIAGNALGLFNAISRDVLVGIFGGLAILSTLRLRQYEKGYKELKGGEQ